MDLVIKKGKIVDESGVYWADIGVENGKIAVIAQELTTEAKTVIDASECLVFPGLIDVHVHFNLPIGNAFSSDTPESGSRAALHGGVTTYIDFTNQVHGQSLVLPFTERLREFSPKTYCDYSLHSVVNDWLPSYGDEINELIDRGVTSYKFFMCEKAPGEKWDDATMFSLMQELKDRGMVIVHAENGHLLRLFRDRAVSERGTGMHAHAASRPVIVEEEAVNRAIYLAEKTGAILMVLHVSSAKAALAIKEARKRGVRVMAETCPQYLLLDDSIYSDLNAHLYGCCPPLRKKEDQEVLWELLAEGSIQIVSTDHCPFWRRDKEKWEGDFRKLFYGLPGVETTLALMYNFGVILGRITLSDLTRLLCSNPARIYGLERSKGSIRVGKDADLVVFDPEQEWTLKPGSLHMACDYNQFEGYKLKGKITRVFRSGELMVNDDVFSVMKPAGRFLSRTAPVFV